MAFPSGPTNNQQATVNGITYVYNSTKTAWLRASTTGANLTANSLTITSNTPSTSTTSGALLVTGGAGIQGNVYASYFIGNGASLTGIASGFSGGNVSGVTNFTSSTASTSTTTGALIVTGGAGISGNLFVGGALTEISSATLKENITPIDGALDLILQLNGVIYDRKDGSRKNEAGLIAEEVNKILPNLISTDDQGTPLGVQYTKLTAYLIEAVKSLKAEIDQLKKRD
jgi:hypothetical protein